MSLIALRVIQSIGYMDYFLHTPGLIALVNLCFRVVPLVNHGYMDSMVHGCFLGCVVETRCKNFLIIFYFYF
jgi:hypothetical protein